MANVKITDLAAYTDPDSTDVLPIVDVGADVTKKVSIADLLENAGSGTEALPGIAFDGDPDTGIYRPGANQLALSTNGAGRLFVDANGNVGVGQAVWTGYGAGGVSLGIKQYSAISAQGLVVESSSNGSSLTLGHTGSVAEISAYYGSSGSYGPLAFKTSNLERLRITSAGLVGIGTSSPAVPLNISSSANGTPATSGTTQTHGSFRIGSSATSGCIDFGPNGQNPWIQATDRTNLSQNYNLLLNPNGGRVGIGTTSPVDTLQINKNATNAASGGLTLKSADSNESFLSLGVSTSLGKACITSSQNGSGTVLPIAFTVGSSSTDEKMRIDSSGRLLVGTSSDSGGALLQVNGNRIRVATAKTPASASDTGTAGEICWDASYVYVCTATNTWKRAALSTW